MTLTREFFLKRITDLSQALQQMQQNIYTTDGALQDARWCLAQFDESEKVQPQPVEQPATVSPISAETP
jgi:hypothetical protein